MLVILSTLSGVRESLAFLALLLNRFPNKRTSERFQQSSSRATEQRQKSVDHSSDNTTCYAWRCVADGRSMQCSVCPDMPLRWSFVMEEARDRAIRSFVKHEAWHGA